ncbi:FAD-dependent oxidoreductase [Pantoea rodasii]|uniref:FAD-dependent oxidoreductase n=1 Tax=Pantoea rodasii TaxID=1076549 RepID=A0A2M9WJ17_9GAMM|nr:FAD-binding oxidoreductase [Pantoea rodasii]ORM61840.1 FAD-dependent oxidoreductase [Pantoea rodasii]PJZ07560.1 FAD-dependent oxidoreductase [Pantoea rodasii]
MTTQKIAIIGGGVIGLAVARALALQGVQVTIFEQQHIGAGTSSTTFAWVNSNGKQPLSYHQLNALSIEEHVKLQRSQPNGLRWLETSGTWEWAAEGEAQQRLLQRATSLQSLGYPAREVTSEALQREIPELRAQAVSGSVWHFPTESVLHPALYLARLWSEARANGAILHQQHAIKSLSEQADGVTLQLANGEQWQGDRVVIATGRWANQLLNTLDLDLALLDTSKPNAVACSFLARTAPQPLSLAANLISPQLNVRPDGGGRLLLQALALDDLADPAAPPSTEGDIARQFRQRYQSLFADAGELQIEKIVVGQRARPADGLPAIGFVTPQQRVYVAVTHSGITLSPLIGKLVAQELVQDHASELLADFRPQRLLGKDADAFAPIKRNFPAAQ